MNIEQVRAAYSKINTIDPDGKGYSDLCNFLDAQDTDTLKALAGANIKFVSKLAINRIIRREH